MRHVRFNQIKRWLNEADRGDAVIYREGPSTWDKEERTATIKAFWQLYTQGAVTLVQESLGGGVYRYIAIRL